MDQEVAGNWLDSMRPDRCFRFRNFEHNCPDPEHSSPYSSASTGQHLSYRSSINPDREPMTDDEGSEKDYLEKIL